MIRSYDMDGCQIGADRFKDKDNMPIQVSWAYIYTDLGVIKVDGKGKDIYQELGAYCILKNFKDQKVCGLANAAIWFADRVADVEVMTNGDLIWPLRKLSERKVDKANEKLHAYLWKKHCEAYPHCEICWTQDETVQKHEDTGNLNLCDECYSLKLAKDAQLAGGGKDD